MHIAHGGVPLGPPNLKRVAVIVELLDSSRVVVIGGVTHGRDGRRVGSPTTGAMVTLYSPTVTPFTCSTHAYPEPS